MARPAAAGKKQEETSSNVVQSNKDLRSPAQFNFGF